MVLNLLPFALVFHLAIGIYMYGQPFIFPKSPQEIKIEIVNKLSNHGIYDIKIFSSENKTIESRVFSSHTLFVLFIISIIVAFTHLFLLKLYKKV